MLHWSSHPKIMNFIKDKSATWIKRSLSQLLLQLRKFKRALIDSSSSSNFISYTKKCIYRATSSLEMIKHRSLSLVLIKIWIVRFPLNEVLNLGRLIKWSLLMMLKILLHLLVSTKYKLRVLALNLMSYPSFIKNFWHLRKHWEVGAVTT